MVARLNRGLFHFIAAVHAHEQPGVGHGRVQLKISFGGDSPEMGAVGATVVRSAIRQDAAREAQLEVDGFFHFLEARIPGSTVGHGVDLGGFLAGQVTRRLQGVDSDIHQRSAARHDFPEPPLRRVDDIEARVGVNDSDRSELLLAGQSDHFLVERLVAAAIGDHQLSIGLARRVDHGLALGRRRGHGLLA